MKDNAALRGKGEAKTESRAQELACKVWTWSLTFCLLSPSVSDLPCCPLNPSSSSIDDGGFHLTIQTEQTDELAVRGPREPKQSDALCTSRQRTVSRFYPILMPRYYSRPSYPRARNQAHLFSTFSSLPYTYSVHNSSRKLNAPSLRIGSIMAFLPLPFFSHSAPQ